MEWKLTDDRPIWSQLSDLVASQIAAGVYGPGERLPSVRELAAEAGVNPNTMQRAMADLESPGAGCGQQNSGKVCDKRYGDDQSPADRTCKGAGGMVPGKNAGSGIHRR